MVQKYTFYLFSSALKHSAYILLMIDRDYTFFFHDGMNSSRLSSKQNYVNRKHYYPRKLHSVK
jgi:hypothetical protein